MSVKDVSSHLESIQPVSPDMLAARMAVGLLLSSGIRATRKSAVQWNSSDDQAYQPKQEEPSDEVSRLSARTHWRGDVKCAMSENA
ncbi:hypothetical protein X801_03902, partial [Opisthorchis viverrini]